MNPHGDSFTVKSASLLFVVIFFTGLLILHGIPLEQVIAAGCPPEFESQWGTYLRDDGKTLSPQGVTVDSSGNMFVADTQNHRIQKFNSNRAFVTKWGTFGTGNGEFIQPVDVVVDNAGNVYVMDMQNDRIQKFSNNGSFITKWGSSGTANGQFQNASGLAIDGAGNVYVADTGNHRVQKFSSNGGFLMAFGLSGTGNGQFNSPTDVAVDSAGNIYVVDRGSRRIQKFTGSGAYLTQWGPSGTGWAFDVYLQGITVDRANNVYVSDASHVLKFSSTGTFITYMYMEDIPYFSSAWGMDVDAANNLYVANDGGSVEQFTSDGAWVATWARDYTGNGDLDSPADLAIDSYGNVYVVERGNNRVQTFSMDGVYLGKWGSQGTGNGQFNQPQGIAIAGGDAAVYVADTGNHRIQKFTRSGAFVSAWGIEGTAAGQFSSPTGIAVDNAGNVYVADSGNNRVQQFNENGVFLRTLTASGDFSNGPFKVAVDSLNNVYASGNCNSVVGDDCQIKQYESNGTFLMDLDLGGNNLAIDQADNIYVSGSVFNGVGGGQVVKKINSQGTLLAEWTVSSVMAVAISTTSSNPVYIASGFGTTGDYGPVIQKFGPVPGASFTVWLDKNGNGSYDSGEEVEGASVWVNHEKRGTTDSNGRICLENIRLLWDEIYAYKQLYSIQNPKADDSNFGSNPDNNPYYACNNTDCMSGIMYNFVMASDIMRDNGEYADVRYTGSNTFIELVHPKIEWNLVVAFESDPSDELIGQVKIGMENASNLIYDYTDGYSLIRNVVLVKNQTFWLDSCFERLPLINIPCIASQWSWSSVHIHDGGVRPWLGYITDDEEGTYPYAGIRSPRKSYVTASVEYPDCWTWDGTEGNPGDEKWAQVLGHELGHYLFAFVDEYYNGNYKRIVDHCGWSDSWDFRINNNGGWSEDNYFPENFGIMDNSNYDELSDRTDYYILATPDKCYFDFTKYDWQNPPPIDGLQCDYMTAQYKVRNGMSAWEWFQKVFEEEIETKTGIDIQIEPPYTEEKYPNTPGRYNDGHKYDKREGPETMRHNNVNVIEWSPGGQATNLRTASPPVSTTLRQAYEGDSFPGTIISARPADSEAVLSITVSGDNLSALPSVTLTQPTGLVNNLTMSSSGTNMYTGDTTYEYLSGDLDVTATSGTYSNRSVSAFNLHEIIAGTTNTVYSPNGNLAMAYFGDSFIDSGIVAIVNSSAPAPSNSNLKHVGDVWSIEFSENITTVADISFTFTFPQNELQGLDITQLRLYGWDMVTNTWNLIDGGTGGFGGFSIMLNSLDYVSYALFAPESIDTQAPDPVTGFQATTGDWRQQIILQWTAPADHDGSTVYAYILQYSNEPITTANWDDCTPAGLVPKPASPGTTQSTFIEMPESSTDYYFAIQSIDAAGNRSPLTTLNTPTKSHAIDTDGDGMPDIWENSNGLDPNIDDSQDDGDDDGLINIEEYQHRTYADDPDTDNDGYSDGDEVQKGSDPTDYLSIPESTVTITKEGTGAGTVTSAPAGINCGNDCSELYDQVTQVTLTATPDAGSTFTGWSGGGCSGTEPCTITMDRDTTVTATFTAEIPAQYTLTVTKSGTGTGTVTSSPVGIDCGTDCTELYDAGRQVTLTASPATGSTFTGWSGGGCSGTESCTVTLNADVTVTANFAVPRPCVERTVCNGSFEQGLERWTSTDNAAIVPGRSGSGVQVSYDNANSDIVQFMKPDPVLENNVFPVGTYHLTAWCLADVGEDCGVYLGDANTWYNAPDHEQEVSQYVPGTGEWQKIDLMLTLTKPEILSVYLYAPKAGSTVVYDDVALEYLPECPDRSLCNGEFDHQLIYWSSTDNAATVPGKNGPGIEIRQDDSNSDAFQFMNGVFEANATYKVSAWCLADVGEDCGIYLGDANTHYNPPGHQREISHYLPGTGAWQEISAMLTLSEAERLSVYLYAPKPNSAVVYDDVTVEKIAPPACDDRAICNGDFEQGLAYWWSLDNASSTYGRTGWGIEVAYDGDGNSDAFQFMNGIFEAGKIYQASAWCLADVGEECGIYLGDANTIVNPPAHEREKSAYLPGNGAWQQVSVTVALDEPERLSVYLYAPQSGSAVIYDDVAVKDVTPYYGYLAEGYTNLGFKTYLALLNPNAQDAHVNVDFLLEDGSTRPYPVTLAANSRRVIDAGVLVDRQGFSTKVESDVPLAVERSMYWPANGAANADGHSTIAMSALNTDWYLAEGYISADFNTYVLLVNPHDEQVVASVTFLLEDGTSLPYSRIMPPTSRQTIDVSALIASGGFSTKIEANKPIMAERTMYWTAGGVPNAGGHNSIALSNPAPTWYLAEGYNSGNFQTYITLMNPNSTSANAAVTLMKEDGTSVPYSRLLPPNSRQTIMTSALIPSGGFATKVAADAPILVERAMYWGAGGVPRAGGHNTSGVSTLATTWYLAEGYVGGGNNFQTYILLLNPNPVEANIAVNFIKDDGTMVPYSRAIPANSRSTILAKSLVQSGGFATKVMADVPVLVERAMYWDVDGVRQAGGHCSVGIRHQEPRALILKDPGDNSFTSYKLTVLKAGSGDGTVAGDRIDCGADCSEVYVDGTVLYLKAEPAAGSTFTGWLINGEQVSGTITVNGDMTVTAIFDTP